MKSENPKNSFYRLDPEVVLRATERVGFRTTGELTQLNSYENRVFDIRLEAGAPYDRVIAKFYRPGRWSQAAIQEEHDFLFELQDEGFAVAAPLPLDQDKSVIAVDGMYFSLFPKIRGRMPEELMAGDLKSVGRLLARVHNVGARSQFCHRPVTAETPFDIWETLDFLSKSVSPELWPRYETAAIELIERFEQEVPRSSYQRIHGDCHRGNIILSSDNLSLVDFDDCGMGPVIQDFWMLFTSATGEDERDLIVEAYEELRQFPREQLHWIPLLRGLRILNYSGWILRRWEDPFFPKTFPDFGTYTMWAEETEAIEKLAWAYRDQKQ